MTRRLTIISFLVVCLLQSISQTDSTFTLEEMVSEFAEIHETEPDPEEIEELLSGKGKINVNQTTLEELQQLTCLSPLQATKLIQYLETYGQVFSIYELQAVEGFDSLTIRRLLPFIVIGPVPPRLKFTPRNLIKHGRHQLVIRYQQLLQRQAGYQTSDSVRVIDPDSYFLGSPQKYYFRYRYTFSDKLMIGLSGEKDAGEQFFGNSQPLGMDFYSGFISLQNLRWMKHLTVGHYRISFGQGLTMGGNSFGSSISFGSSMQYLNGFRPSQSVCEYGYLRGAALTIQTGRLEWSGFISYASRDAIVSFADTTLDVPTFSSITESGYHRKYTEISKKNTIKELVYGGHCSYRGKFFIIGITGYYGAWSEIFQPTEKLYRKFSLQDSKFGAIGIDSRFRISFCQLFGEYSMSLNGGRAWNAGITVTPFPGVDLLTIIRSYQRNYQNPFSTALSQNSQPANEQGLFIRLHIQLFPRVAITCYSDLYRFPWITYRCNSPSEGVEAGILATYQVSPNWSLILRYSLKRNQVNRSETAYKIKSVASGKTDNLRIEVRAYATPALRVKSCFNFKSYREDGEESSPGYLISQEVRYKPIRHSWAVTFKYALFDIPAFETRIYSYEPDVLYGWSAPAYYGRGARAVMLLCKDLGKHIELWGWFGIWKYVDRATIGSGMEEIEGSVKSEVKVQVRLKL